LAVVLDAYSRRVIGWALDRSLEDDLAMVALQMAFRRRKPGEGLTHHSDRGVQYASNDYTALLKQHGVRISMSRSGNPYDNATCESFMKTLKYEEVYRQQYRDLADARASIEKFMEKVYNAKRLHSALGYRPPVECERSLPMISFSSAPAPHQVVVCKMRAPSEGVFSGMTESIGPMCPHLFLPLGVPAFRSGRRQV
jgi:putative transposase